MIVIRFCYYFISAPNPSNVINVLGTKCVNTGGVGNKEWFIPRGSGPEKCIQYENLDDPRIEDDRISANQVIKKKKFILFQFLSCIDIIDSNLKLF